MSAVSIPLDGCRTAPLGAYLQGLGVWRAVARVADPDARASWQDGRLILHTQLSTGQVLEALAEKFRPLPIVSPWNAGSGFAANGKSVAAEEALQAVRNSEDPRFAQLRQAVLVADQVVKAGRSAGWEGKGDKLWDERHKADVIALCRNLLPDESVAWLDTAVVTTQNADGSSTVTYNRLLGSGGNFGRQDLQATYVQRALFLLTDPKGRASSDGWLRGVLFGDETTPYLRDAVGQFDPGRAGGIQSSPAEKADDSGFANPWAFLLTVEGATLFAAAAGRRHGTGTVRAALPFVVRSSGVGYGSSADAENVSAEIWTPLWDRPATLAEVEHLLHEGRAQWRGETAGSGLDFARAAATLGVDRGVTGFVRSVFAERLGQNPLAVPVGEITVTRRPGVGLLAQVDPWLWRLRRDALPSAIRGQVRRVDDAMYSAAVGPANGSLLRVLVEVGRLHELVARSGAARRVVPPLSLEGPGDWWDQIAGEDPGPEVRIALALASGADGHAADRRQRSPLRALLQGWWRPDPAGGRSRWEAPAVSTSGSVMAAVADAHQLRCRPGAVEDPATSEANLRDEWPLPAVRGVYGAFRSGWPVTAGEVAALATNRLDLVAVEDHLRAFLLFTGFGSPPGSFTDAGRDVHLGDGWPLPPGLALLLPFFGSRPIRVAFAAGEPQRRILLRPGSGWVAQLRSGRVAPVLQDAAARLRVAGARSLIAADPAAQSLDGVALAAALLVPVRAARRRALAGVAVLESTAPNGVMSADTADTDSNHETTDEGVPA